jgi:uncharacterized membrane protein
VPTPSKGASRTYDAERMAMLSDGIVAIAITLLVLDLKPEEPPVPGVDILHELRNNVPDFLAWFVAFVVICRLWMTHHHVLARLRRCRAGTIVANFAFLGAVTLLPFGASVVGAYQFDDTMAVVVFSFMLGLAGFLLGIFMVRAAEDERAEHEPDPDLVRVRRYHLVGVPLVALVAALLGLVQPLATMAVWLAESIAVIAVLATRRTVEGAQIGEPV